VADETQEQRLAVEARWVGLETTPIALANQAVGQVNAGEIIVTFGQVVPPPLIGDPEDRMRQMEGIEFLPIVPVARLTMTIGRLRAFKQTLEETIDIYERQALEEEEHGKRHEPEGGAAA
jgi:hypothetical protein